MMPSSFKEAVLRYGFPASDPVYSIDLSGAEGQRRVLFRPAGRKVDRHTSITDFWACALFNFLEDAGDDNSFEELGQSGEYRTASASEVATFLGSFIGSTSGTYITSPSNPSVCILVHDSAELMSIVGEDSNGFFAAFAAPWEAA